MPKLTWFSSTVDELNGKQKSEANSLFHVTSKSFNDGRSEDFLETESSIKIPVLTREYYGKSYRCEARNNNVTIPASSTITIDMRCKFWSPILDIGKPLHTLLRKYTVS